MTRTDADGVLKMVGRRYPPQCCYAVVRDALDALGVGLPLDPAELLHERWREWGRELPRRETCRLGDVLVFAQKGPGKDGTVVPHMGVALNVFDFVHLADEHVRLDKIATWWRLNPAVRVYRPLRLEWEKSGRG